MDEIILGIDLGTTNSLAAVFGPGGPEIITDASGEALVPSVIAFSPEGSSQKITVGCDARDRAVENPLSSLGLRISLA